MGKHVLLRKQRIASIQTKDNLTETGFDIGCRTE